jgi:hypothetical protein
VTIVDKNEFTDFAQFAFTCIRNAFDAQGVALPDRQYMTVGSRGEVPHDTEQITLTLEQVYSGFPGITATTAMNVWDPRTATFVVELVRQIPIPGDSDAPPSNTSVSRFDRIKSEMAASKNPEQIAPIDLLDDDTLTAMALDQMRDMACLYDAGMTLSDLYQQGVSIDVMAGPPSGAFQGVIMSIGFTTTGLIPQ